MAIRKSGPAGRQLSGAKGNSRNASQTVSAPSRRASVSKTQAARGKLLGSYRMKPYFSKPKLLGKPTVSLQRAFSLRENPFARNSFDVAVMSLKPMRNDKSLPMLKDWLMFKARTKTNKNGHIHEVVLYIEPLVDGTVSKASKVCYTCSDPSHVFWGMEWHNSRPQYGLSPLYYSNGQKPVVRRPGKDRPTLCKHCTSVLRYIVGKKLVKIHDPRSATAKSNDQSKLKSPIGKRGKK